MTKIKKIVKKSIFMLVYIKIIKYECFIINDELYLNRKKI